MRDQRALSQRASEHTEKKTPFQCRSHGANWQGLCEGNMGFPGARVQPFRCRSNHAHIHNSATGTRTRVARVRAEYPNQLDYSGVGIFDRCCSIVGT